MTQKPCKNTNALHCTAISPALVLVLSTIDDDYSELDIHFVNSFYFSHSKGSHSLIGCYVLACATSFSLGGYQQIEHLVTCLA